MASLSDRLQTDARVASLEVKLKKLDAELSVFKTQMSKMREGPGKAAVQQRALRVLKQKKMYENQLGQLQQQTYNMEQAAMTTENLKNTVSISSNVMALRTDRFTTFKMATVDAMRVANKEMKKQYKGINIDKIEVCSSINQESLHPLYHLKSDVPTIRVFITTWKISLSKPMIYKSL